MRISSSATNHARRLYQLGSFFVIPVFFLCLAVLGLSLIPYFNQLIEILAPTLLNIMMYSWLGFMGSCAVSFIFDLSYGLRKYWSSPVRNYVSIFVLFIAGLISVMVSRQLINFMTGGVDPSSLAGSVTALASLLTPIIYPGTAFIVLPLIFHIAYIALMPIGFNFALLARSIPQISRRLSLPEWEVFILWGGRAVGSVTLALVLFLSSVNLLRLTHNQVSWLLTNIIVRSSHHELSNECKNYKVGEWIASIGNNKINVAVPDKVVGFRFEKRNCN